MSETNEAFPEEKQVQEEIGFLQKKKEKKEALTTGNLVG